MCGPNVIVDLKVILQKRRNLERKNVGDTEAASGSTMEEPQPKPGNDSQKRPKVPAKELFILFRNFRGLRFPDRKEDSVRVPKRAAGHLS